MSERQSEGERTEQRRRRIEDLRSELRDAVRSGDVEELKKIVNECPVENGERGELLNSLCYGQWTILHFAVENKQVPIIKWLLSEREGEGRHSGFTTVLEKSSMGGETALHIAVKRGFFDGFLAIANGLRIDNGEQQEMLNAVNRGDCTLLHTAAGCNQVSIIQWLLSDKAGEGRSSGFDKVFAKTIHRPLNALRVAVEKGYVEAFQAIVNGCRVDNGERQEILNDVTSNNRTILHLAAEKEQASIITWILSEEGGRAAGFDRALVRAKYDGTALHIAASTCLETFLAVINGLRVDNGEQQEMLHAVDNVGRTILHKAAECGREDIIVWLLSNEGGRAVGFDRVSSRTDDKCTALHYAVQYSRYNSIPARAILSNCTNEERMNLFLAVDEHGWTALHKAARSHKEDIIAEILSYPECALIVNRKDNLGMTALHRAIIGGIDKESRDEWAPYHFEPNKQIIRRLLGLDEDSSSSTKAWIDPNIGLGLL